MNIFFWASLLAVSTTLVSGCHGVDSAPPAATQTAQARVVESEQRQVPVNLRVTGTVHSRETTIVSAQVMSRIQKVLVLEGDAVNAGQTLVVLDDSTFRSASDQAQAGVNAAQGQQAAAETDSKLAASTLARYQQLEAQKSVSPQEMDEVTRRAEAAAARLEAVRGQTAVARAQESGAHTMLGYAQLVAPFSGLVTARMADPGTMAAPGVPLLQIDRAGPLQLEVTVDQSAIGVVRKGMKVRVDIAGSSPNGTLGSISEIVPAADPASHGFQVKIDLPASNQLRAGMYGTAQIANGTRQAILIPRSSVVSRGSLSSAYVIDSQGIAQLRYLTLGAVQGSQVEVLSGLFAGEKLVDAPADRELAGKRIEVQR